jgi:nucleotide-binding universal stress UspA family protein
MTMFKRILVPLDESTLAEQAIPVALRIAQATNGVVILLHVVYPITELWPVPPERWSMTYTVEAHVADAKQYLARVIRTINTQEVTVETEIAIGPPAQGIISAISTFKADIVVLCSHGYTGLKRWAIGSVAEKVAHAAPVPVLLLRRGGTSLVGPHPDALQPLRILVPLDGSSYAKTALPPALSLITELAGTAPAAIHLLKVVPPIPVDEKKDPYLLKKRLLQRSLRYLAATSRLLSENMQKQLAPAPLPPTITWSVVADTDVATAIVQAAEQGNNMGEMGSAGRCDIIAMATHGYSGLYRWTMGSVTERVLHATKQPLLIVRPTQSTTKERSDWLTTTMAALQR